MSCRAVSSQKCRSCLDDPIPLCCWKRCGQLQPLTKQACFRKKKQTRILENLNNGPNSILSTDFSGHPLIGSALQTPHAKESLFGGWKPSFQVYDLETGRHNPKRKPPPPHQRLPGALTVLFSLRFIFIFGFISYSFGWFMMFVCPEGTKCSVLYVVFEG